MKILEDTILRDHYDVIVVGAGLGGMVAASLIAKRGLQVLLIDQQNKPGGSCTSFKRKDMVHDVGTVMIYGFGQKGFKPFHFILNTLEEPIDVIAHPTLARMTIEGEPLIFHADVDQYLEELSQQFPESRQGLRSLFDELYGMYENIVIKNQVIVPPTEFSPRQGLRSLLSNPLGLVRMQKLLSTSTRELIEKHLTDDRTMDFFDKLCSAYCYCTTDETPAVLAATMFLDNHIGGVYSPAGGAQSLPNALEKSLEGFGGQTLYRHLVDEILIKDQAAYGVRLSDGTTILADRVIADATVWNIYGKLIKPKHSDAQRRKWARELIPTFPSMTLYMRVDRRAFPAGTFPWEIFIENREKIESTDLTLYINSLVDKTLSPDGDLAVMAIAPNLEKWPAADEPAYHSAQYRHFKKCEAEKMLDQIESHFPGFRKHIRSILIGSPTTIERYLLKNWGAVGGPKNSLGQEMTRRLHARSEWKNLYFCGDSTVMATGAPATAVSGVGAANVVLQDARKPDYDVRRFEKNVIRFVNLPYQKPRYRGEAITTKNARLAAAQCQWCEHPACKVDCPAGIDIPGFLRRMDANNTIGAARLIRTKNPFGEVCGHACVANQLCQKRCERLSFTRAPVQIASLERQACKQAGKQGWLKSESNASGKRVAIIGGSISSLTCAYYLSLTGTQVELLHPDGKILDGLVKEYSLAAEAAKAMQRDLMGILASGNISILKTNDAAEQLKTFQRTYSAIYFPVCNHAHKELIDQVYSKGWEKDGLKSSSQVKSSPKWFISHEYPQVKGHAIIHQVAQGRKMAQSIQEFLHQ